MSPMSRSYDAPDDADLARLEEAERELSRRIAEVESLPDRLRREAEERAATLPPPDDLADRRRRRDFETKVSRGQLRNERRAQRRSLLLTVLLLASIAGLISWVIRLAQS